jgi:hypothetical protein
MPLRRREFLRVTTASVVGGFAACSRQQSPAPQGIVVRSGSDVIPPRIALTPQTVVVPSRARALVGVSNDHKALRMTGVDVKPGSVVLLQDVGVFRAKAVQPGNRGELLVTPAPCAISDLIADGDVRFENIRIRPPAGRPSGSTPMAARFTDLLIPPLAAQDSGAASGKVGAFDYQIQYTATDDAVNFDASTNGDLAGFLTKVTATGHLTGFDLSGGVSVRRGAPESLALLVKAIAGEVTVDATAARHDNAAHPGNQMLKIPKEYVWPIVIDGIPFLLKLGVALLLNEGLTNTDAQVRFGVKLTFKGSSGFDMRLPGDPKKAEPKMETALDNDFSFTHAESVGLGPQALLVAMQCPRLAFGLGLDLPFVDVFTGPYIDIVTSASHTAAGAMAIVPCQRNQIVVAGTVGCEGAFVRWNGDMRVEAYRREIVRAVPDTAACRGR